MNNEKRTWQLLHTDHGNAIEDASANTLILKKNPPKTTNITPSYIGAKHFLGFINSLTDD